MKGLIAALAIAVSSMAFAQSMLVLNTGKVLTINDQGMLFDLGNFLLPYEIKEMGGRYIIDKDRKLRTVDQNGVLYSKEREDKVPNNVEFFGDNYFISKKGLLYTIDENGFLYEVEKEKAYKDIKHKGGNFFISEKKVEKKKTLALFVVNNSGQVAEMNVPGLNLEKVNYVGGRYFTTTAAELFTVSHDGFVYSKKSVGAFRGSDMKKGGNYFILRGNVHTVSDSGIVTNYGSVQSYGYAKHYGTNFFISPDGKLYTISSSGVIKNVNFGYKPSDISHFSHL